MNKKVIISLILIAALAFGAGLGTFAYYTKTFESKNNIIKAATFEVDTQGNLTGEKNFEIDKFAPGFNGFWEFFVDRTNSHVRVGSYNINVNTTYAYDNQVWENYLFRTGTPIIFDLYRHNSITDEWGPVEYNIDMNRDYTVLANDNDAYKSDWFRLVYRWPWETEGIDDNEFKGNSGKVNVAVTAIQGKDNERVIFANCLVTNYNNGVLSNSTVRIVVDENETIKGVEGYDKQLDELVYVDNPKSLNSIPVKNNGLKDVNGNYAFGASPAKIEIEIDPIMN